MITIRQTRKRGREFFNLGTHDDSSQGALELLVKAELGWGGVITNLTPSQITVETHVMGSLDSTTFVGSIEELKPLFDTCAFHIALGKHENIFRDKAAEEAMRVTGGVPLLLEMAGPMLIGGTRAKLAVMLAAGINDQDELRIGIASSIEDLLVALELRRESNETLRDLLGKAA